MKSLEQTICECARKAEANRELAKYNKSHVDRANDLKNAEECEQLSAWLRELVERRKAPEIVYCHECIHFQCNMRFDGSVPKGADAYECRRGCGGCDPMDYCSYGERAERRTDGRNR